MNAEPVQRGEVVFLVHGGCGTCGWWLALPEGALWPDCPVCHGSTWPSRRHGEHLGYVAVMADEQVAVRAANGDDVPFLRRQEV